MEKEISFRRTNSSDAGFQSLVKELDQYLASRDGDEHAFYAQFNKIDMLRHVLIAEMNSEAIACGAFKPYDEKTAEIKRMYVRPSVRGKGVATMILRELERWAREEGYLETILETGKRQPEAISLYKKNGYRVIPNFGQYEGKENSVCFIKIVGAHNEKV
jgi:putative acetyltransferase